MDVAAGQHQSFVVEQLIDQVKSFPCLYDVYNVKYNDYNKKEMIWAEIAKNMNQPASMCKKSWANLRDSLRRALKKRRFSENAPHKKWRYEEEMTFLLPFFREKDFSRVDTVPIDFDVNTMRYDSEPMPVKTEMKLIKEEASLEGAGTAADNLNEDLLSKSKSKRLSSSAQNSSSKKHRTSAALNEDVDVFFASIAATVKRLTPYNIAIAKSKIFQIVNSLEMKELENAQFQQVAELPTIAQEMPQNQLNIPMQNETENANTATMYY